MAAPSPQVSVSDQIRQLNDARKLVLGDVKYYPTVVKSILPIVGPTAGVELRRWGADFLAEAFATPALPGSEKETMQLFVLDTLQTMVETPNEDAHVLRSAIQTAASIYPFALRWMYVRIYFIGMLWLRCVHRRLIGSVASTTRTTHLHGNEWSR